MHIWTVILAYHHSGIISAIITALLPVFAEIFWLLSICFSTGTLFNIYSLAVMCFVAASYILRKLKPIDVHVGAW